MKATSKRLLTSLAAIGLLLVGPTATAVPERDGTGQPGPPAHAFERLSPRAAEALGLWPAPRGDAWFMTEDVAHTDTSIDPLSGQDVTTSGTYRQYVLADAAITDISAAGQITVAAAGCYIGEYTSPPYRNYYGYPSYKYGPRAYAWKEVGSGCDYGRSFSSRLKEHHALNYSPSVAYATGRAEPGAGRRTLYVGYTGLTQCETYSHTANDQYYPGVQVCP